jgi:hypothetical protein
MNNDTPTLHNTLFLGTENGVPVPLPYAELLDHYAEVRDAVARSMHVDHELSPDLATYVSMLSFVYAFNAYKALGMILPERYHESGAVILRQLWEVSLNMHWIQRDPLRRAQDFCNFTVIEYRKLLQKCGESSLEDFDRATSKFQEKFHFRDKKGRNQRHSVFATKSVSDRANELGDPWKSQYQVVYHLASLHTHGAPGAILHTHFRQYYSEPETRERNSVALLAILAINVLVRDLRLLMRSGVIRNCDPVDKAFASFENTMARVRTRRASSAEPGGLADRPND